MEYQKERGRIRANSTFNNWKRSNLANFKVSYGLKRVSFPFWTLKGNYFMLLCLDCSYRGGICIVNSTRRCISDWQVRNATSVANPVFENTEGNFKTKQNIHKIVWNWVLVQKKRVNLESVRSMVEWRVFSKKKLLFFPVEQTGVLPLAAVHTSTKWFKQNSKGLGSMLGAWSGHTACNCLVFQKLIIKQMCKVLRKFVEYVWPYECVGAVLW